MRPRLLIVQPSHYRSRRELCPVRIGKRSLVGLTLPYLAALTPPEWEVMLVDEAVSGVDFSSEVDVVAITAWSINSLRAYEIGDIFKRRGTPVIMGGPHTYFYPEESIEHCDAVGIGEGEAIWRPMLEDALTNRLKRFYTSDCPNSLRNLPLPRHDLLDSSKYGLIKTYSVQTSRGCPFRCEYCSERYYLGDEYRYRPVEDVVSEIRQINSGQIFFADSNFAGRPNHTLELMEALIPLKIRWSALWPAYLCRNDEFMDTAKKSGLLHINIGIESLDQQTLSGMGKKSNRVREYREILNGLRKRGVSYSLNFIFGWDTENADVFPSTEEFLEGQMVPVAYFNILTPHKGTVLFDRMLADDRIIDPDGIGRWPGIHCHIKPLYCSAKELEERVKKMYRDFYGYRSMFQRLPPPLTKADLASWFLNFSQRRMSRTDEEFENFDGY